ncbi:cutinase transcription factor 1 beta [Fusarium albosuccineum]|uniref:Cutinase transcription factor 1 beta n=1 Tax=Fusarium albosuccineum TaxID=1237068 RepID=A0A8H4L8F9_9HYPO|nr:cutinase transcription factor 1 beta [Fusarium albosuccineum]
MELVGRGTLIGDFKAHDAEFRHDKSSSGAETSHEGLFGLSREKVCGQSQTFQVKDAFFPGGNPFSSTELCLPTAFSDDSSGNSPGTPSMCFRDLWDPSLAGFNRDMINQTQPFVTDANTRKNTHGSTSRTRMNSEAEIISQSHVIYSYYPFLDLDISALSPGDVQYLETQGCFRVPTRQALDEFVREYFLHVHPGLPLLDESMFWDMYSGHAQPQGQSNLSLFVFQAMLFASCSFLPFSILQSLGFNSIRDARDTYYRRAKLLFDLCGERNLVSNSQGALLLSYNATMKDQKRTNSIWLATAIHLAQAAGADQFYSISDRNQNELKRLWWCCIVRDRILPLGVRRQLHITSIDLNLDRHSLTEKDFEREIEASQVYGSQTKRTLVQLFITLCELAVALTDVVKVVYATGRSIDDNSPCMRNLQQTCESVRSCERGLDAWFEKATIQFPTPAGIVSTEESLVLYTNLTYIYYYSARFALYQYEAFVISLGSEGVERDDKLRETRSQLEDATLGITDNLKELIQLKLGKYLPISIVAYAALPLVLHILDVKLAKKPAQTAQKQGRLNVYMETMKGMQDLYDGVDDVWTFIRTAVDYATVEGIDLSPNPSNESNLDVSRVLYSKTPKSIKAANDWGNVLLQEPILYFRLSRAIDLSLALGRYSEDSSLCLSPVSARFPPPRFILIDVGAPNQITQGETDKTSRDKQRASKVGRDQYSPQISQIIEEMDDCATFDFGVGDLQTPTFFNEFELGLD